VCTIRMVVVGLLVVLPSCAHASGHEAPHPNSGNAAPQPRIPPPITFPQGVLFDGNPNIVDHSPGSPLRSPGRCPALATASPSHRVLTARRHRRKQSPARNQTDGRWTPQSGAVST